MAWGDNRDKNYNDEPLWSLVADGCQSTCVTLYAETQEARQQRREGTLESDGKITLRELDDDLNRFINRGRRDGQHEMLIKLVAVVCNESAQLEASKSRERFQNSSIS